MDPLVAVSLDLSAGAGQFLHLALILGELLDRGDIKKRRDGKRRGGMLWGLGHVELGLCPLGVQVKCALEPPKLGPIGAR